MNTNKRLKNLITAALIAALYAGLTYLQNFIFPGSTSMAVQFRVSEVLCVLALYTSTAIPGLTVGCIIANIVNITTLPLDVVLGSCATLIAALLMYALRNVKILNIPILALLMPAVCNGIIIGLEIEIFFISGAFNFVSFLTQAGLVALGELGVCFILGIPFYFAIQKSKLFTKTE